MKKYIKITVLFVLVLFATTSCSDSYFDVNTPVDRDSENDVQISELLPTTELYLNGLPYSIGIGGFSYYAQDMAAIDGTNESADKQYEITEAGAWSTIYLNILAQTKVIKRKADEAGAKHYNGIAKVLEATALGYAIDTWGDIPYSEALQEIANPTPIFDSQESVYNAIMALLNDAVTDLSAADTSGLVPGADDLYYNGDIAKWIKAAHTLMARNAIHLTKAGTVTAANNALTHLNLGFTSNADNMQIVYTTRSKNPWNTGVVAQAQAGIFFTKASAQIVDYMNGTSFPFNTISVDPRAPIYFDNGGAATYVGITNGQGDTGVENAVFNPAYFTFDAPLATITYAEAQFIRAEAEFLANGGTVTSMGSNAAAYQAYQDGIAASMDAVGVAAADKAAYLADTSVDVGMANLELKYIMREKAVANWLNPENYNDQRRYDFSADAFVNLAQPIAVNPDNGGLWVRRSDIPFTERTANPNAENARQPITTPVWWDL